MFNLLLALTTGLIIGWNFHVFFMQLTPPKLLINDVNDSTISQLKSTPLQECPKKLETIKTVKKTVVTPLTEIPLPPKKKPTSFSELLDNDLFSDAMMLYVDANEAKLLLYQTTLLKYFEVKVKTTPQKVIEEMLEFQELEPSTKKNNMESFHELADNHYEEKAKILFNLIKEKLTKANEYTYQLALQKIGEHFAIDVKINDSLVTLLLDTGATLTMVNEKKLSSTLTLLQENIQLNTAGGEITAQLQEADTFCIGEIELEAFQIVSSSFEQKDADGLLGMNFFKKFKFKIDQEKALLYLSRLSSSE